jgi:hypothetical protein
MASNRRAKGLLNKAKAAGLDAANVAASPMPANTGVDTENNPTRNDAAQNAEYEPLPLNPVGTISAQTTQQLDALATDKTVNWEAEFIPGQIAANSYYGPLLQNFLRSLPRPTDDVERDFGIDIYEKMLNDPAVSSSIQALKVQALSSGVRFTGRVPKPSPWQTDDKSEAAYQCSEALLAFIEKAMDGLQQPLSAIVSDMLDCLAYGHSIAEMVFEPKGGKLTLTALRVKNRYRFAYVCDRFLSFLGLVPTEKAAGIIPVEWVLPRRKFWHLTLFTHQSDPRGRSLLRPAYNAWYLKQKTWINYFKYLLQFATPSLVALLDDLAQDGHLADERGNIIRQANGMPVTQSAEEMVTAKLAAFANSSALALRYVKSFQVIQATGAGEPYLNAIDLYNREIAQAIIMAPRAIMEAEHGSKADSSTGKDLLDTFTSYIQRETEAAFYRDVIHPLCVMNFGQADADAYAPVMLLSSDNQRDTVQYGNMVANLARAGYLHTSQYEGIDAQIGLPERDAEAMAAEAEAQQQAEADRAQQYQNLLNPGNDAGLADDGPTSTTGDTGEDDGDD